MWGGHSCQAFLPADRFPAGPAAWKGGCGRDWTPHEDENAGATEAEALDNISDAIREYLCAVAESLQESNIREVEVSVQRVPKLAGVPHLRAVRALDKAGFTVAREGSRQIREGAKKTCYPLRVLPGGLT
jgi:hypothetical protein